MEIISSEGIGDTPIFWMVGNCLKMARNPYIQRLLEGVPFMENSLPYVAI